MNKNSKIYVAGHTGLVGSALLRRLDAYGYTKIVTRTFDELDLRNQQAVNSFFTLEKPDVVFIAAAKVGGILANDTYKAQFIYDNLMIATNLIHASYKFGINKLLNLGSSCIYPKHAPQPMKEEYLLSGSLEPTNEPYAIAKIAAIKLCSSYNQEYGTNFISIMPTNLYGQNDNFNLETAHVLPALLRKFHLAKLLQERNFAALRLDLQRYPIGYGLDEKIDLADCMSIEQTLAQIGITEQVVTVWGSGQPHREFLHVDGLSCAAVFLMENYSAQQIGEYINVGTGTDIQIKELADHIKKFVGFTGKINYDETKPDGAPRKLLDVTRLEKLSWKSRIDLQEGLTRTYTWYTNSLRTNHEQCHVEQYF
jgi:GDP-L-fucose synthase